MKYITRKPLNVVLFVSFLFSFAFAHAADGKEDTRVITKTYRSQSGYMCYASRHMFRPDTTTFVTNFPEFINSKNISNCLSRMEKREWKVSVLSTPVELVDMLREARTQNMACAHVGVYQTPMLYQVRFAALSLTGKDDELHDCMVLAASAPNKAAPPAAGNQGIRDL